MFKPTPEVLLNYHRAQREVDRILAGPVPIEQTPKQIWQLALSEAEVLRDNAANECVAAGIIK